MTFNEAVDECLRRLKVEPTTPVRRVIESVCHYQDRDRRHNILLSVMRRLEVTRQ